MIKKNYIKTKSFTIEHDPGHIGYILQSHADEVLVSPSRLGQS